jgi:hypothetical protein
VFQPFDDFAAAFFDDKSIFISTILHQPIRLFPLNPRQQRVSMREIVPPPFANCNPRFLRRNIGNMEISHASDFVIFGHSIAINGENNLFSATYQGHVFGVNLRHKKRRSPPENVVVVFRFTCIHQKQTIAVR